ncbi:MAG: indolepyruvate oxidoreductase subunit beta [Synergistaceae bacterium]|jgi:indolepyruvate ferredoxin oxidoreductase beta subunit|nr:indolepyruvate oxidoreductase subunit beta [Synergistaceae bacterium]
MSDVKNQDRAGSILLVGVGGQGTILASKVLSLGLMRAGSDVKMSEIHGMSQRGGSVSTHVKFGPAVFSPIISEGEADTLVAFEKVEAARWLSYLRPRGMLVVNDYEIRPLSVLTGAAIYPDDVIGRLREAVPGIIAFDAGAVASELGSGRAQNIVLLGALVRCMGLDYVDWETVLKDTVPPKTYELNLRAFEAGRAWGSGSCQAG